MKRKDLFLIFAIVAGIHVLRKKRPEPIRLPTTVIEVTPPAPPSLKSVK